LLLARQKQKGVIKQICYLERRCERMDENVKKTLQKQLQLLSERSKECPEELPALTHAMCEVANVLIEDFVSENDIQWVK
jgi:hypothetical protein